MKNHERLIIIIIVGMVNAFCYPLLLKAQAPQSIAYQAIVRDADGNPMANQPVSIQITLHQGSDVGVEVYCETHSITTNPLGLVNLQIGQGSVVFGSFPAIAWESGVYYLEVELDPAGGTAYVALGTTQLVSVPYALFSEETAQTYSAGTGIDIIDHTIYNIAPDQEVVINGDAGISVAGAYPVFTLANTLPDQPVTMYSGFGIDVTGTYPDFTISNTIPDQVIYLNPGDGIAISGVYPDFTVTNLSPNVSHSGDAIGADVLTVAGIQGRPVSSAVPGTDQVLQWNGVQWQPATLSGGGTPAWSLTGNGGTNPSVNFLGTTDNQPLRFRVNNLPAGEMHPTRDNTFIGEQAGDNSMGEQNTALGSQALHSNLSGCWNTAIGAQALSSAQAGYSNTACGLMALYSNTTGGWNTATGVNALKYNTTGDFNTTSGVGSLNNNSTGKNNTASGYQALFNNSTGYSNVAIGIGALYHNATRSNLVAIGDSALFHNEQGGYQAFHATKNTALGSKALFSNNIGSANTAAGGLALYSNTEGAMNTANGYRALYSNSTGIQNTALGSEAGNANSTGSGNVFLGYRAGYNETGSNKLYIANSSTNPPLIYGDFSTGKVGLGTTSPHASARLEVSSTTQGFLPPRMTSAQRTAITSPAAGLLVFQTDAPSGYYYYTGTNWVSIEGTGAGSPSSCIDYDGNAYPTITIGTQVWIAENLRVTHYRNGDPIPNVTDNSAWGALTTGAYCWYDNNQNENEKYGVLYNWYAVDDSRGLCPTGWHEPTDAEWTTFTTYLGGESVAGGKMKSVSALWYNPNTDATNNSGFSGLPGGRRWGWIGGFSDLTLVGCFWSATHLSDFASHNQRLYYISADVSLWCDEKDFGFSVRCLKD